MTRASPILQSVSVRAICPNGFVWSYRTRAPVGLKTETFLETSASRASTIFASATYLPLLQGSGNWGRTVERNTPIVPVRPLFIFLKLVAGRTRDIMRPAFPTLGTIWSGIRFWPAPAYTAGKCFSFLYSLLQFRQEPGSVVRVSLSPTPLLSALCHVEKHDSRRDGNARIQIGEVRNVVR